jgi:ribosomal protein L40E
MARKTIGHIELEWICKRCGTKNPGLQKTCLSCGAIMESQDQFVSPEQSELITDQDVLMGAERGEDTHCPYCGARNAAGTANCSQCSGGLAEGSSRASGKVLGSFKSGPAPDIVCPACSTPNPARATRCTQCGGSIVVEPDPTYPAPTTAARARAKPKFLLFGTAAVIILLSIIYLISLAGRRQEIPATVADARWERSIEVMEERLIAYSDWKDEIPSNAINLTCSDEVRTKQSEPAPDAEEVCGEPYTLDQGNGMGRVVQDCEYHIYDDWCSYEIYEWRVIEIHRNQGSDLFPDWPAFVLSPGQQEGDRNENYTVTFRAENERKYSYSPKNVDQFSQFIPSSAWLLKVNGLGGVVDLTKR